MGQDRDIHCEGPQPRSNLNHAREIAAGCRPRNDGLWAVSYLRANARTAAEIQNRHHAPVSIPANGMTVRFMIGS